jgi:hypothetical protein
MHVPYTPEVPFAAATDALIKQFLDETDNDRPLHMPACCVEEMRN